VARLVASSSLAHLIRDHVAMGAQSLDFTRVNMKPLLSSFLVNPQVERLDPKPLD
jgi:hypothetical protein